MPDKLSLALAQLNPTVGDIPGNIAKLRKVRKQAAEKGADLLMTAELYICGYPAGDLVLKRSFQETINRGVEDLARDTADGGPAILLSTPWREGDKLYNAVLLLDQGKIAGKVFKCDLPNYGPFDEKRIFAPGPPQEPIEFRGLKLGVTICEDMWTPSAAKNLKDRGAQILLVPNASPYEIGKFDARLNLARARVKETGLPLVYVHQVGGQDELVFDGASFVLNADGECVAQSKRWDEDLTVTNWTIKDNKLSPHVTHQETIEKGEAAIYNALMLGLRDYVTKNGFPGILLGLSGGMDSALVALLAVDAVGADKVWCVMLPSPYTSDESKEDAAKLAKILKCRYDTIHITMAMDAFGASLESVFQGKKPDVTEENIQSRSRALILMAISNKFGPIVVSTGNKSELAVGYSTLYGDLSGGFAVLKDVYKTQVYKVARWRNANKPATALGPSGVVIPERIFTKAPTAELRPNQKDQDTLPPYETLDAILECMIEKDLGLQDIVKQGFEAETVKRIWRMLDTAEYKRRQAPAGVKVTNRHLSLDRRYPITNKYRET